MSSRPEITILLQAQQAAGGGSNLQEPGIQEGMRNVSEQQHLAEGDTNTAKEQLSPTMQAVNRSLQKLQLSKASKPTPDGGMGDTSKQDGPEISPMYESSRMAQLPKQGMHVPTCNDSAPRAARLRDPQATPHDTEKPLPDLHKAVAPPFSHPIDPRSESSPLEQVCMLSFTGSHDYSN